jgi:hypothetical protein
MMTMESVPYKPGRRSTVYEVRPKLRSAKHQTAATPYQADLPAETQAVKADPLWFSNSDLPPSSVSLDY